MRASSIFKILLEFSCIQWYAHDLIAFMLWGSLSIQSTLFFCWNWRKYWWYFYVLSAFRKGCLVFAIAKVLMETIWVMCTLKRVPNITKIPTRCACFERCALAKVRIAYYGFVHFKTSAYRRQGFDDNILGLVCTKWDAYCIQGYNGPTFWTKCCPKVVLTMPKVLMETMQTINFLKGMPTKSTTSMGTILLFMKTQKCMHIVM